MHRNGKGSVERRFIDWKRLKKNHENMRWPMKRRMYKIQKRNGCYAIDEYKSESHSNVIRTISNLTREQAILLVNEINTGIDNFIKDNNLEK